MRATEFLNKLLSRDEVVRLFNNPQVTADLDDAIEWFPGKEVSFIVKENVPMSIFNNQALEMLSTYDEFPQEAKRTAKIKQLILKGGKQLPIFVDTIDIGHNFIVEGRHRIVAFYELGLTSVTVIEIVKSEPQVNEIAYAINAHRNVGRDLE